MCFSKLLHLCWVFCIMAINDPLFSCSSSQDLYNKKAASW